MSGFLTVASLPIQETRRPLRRLRDSSTVLVWLFPQELSKLGTDRTRRIALRSGSAVRFVRSPFGSSPIQKASRPSFRTGPTPLVQSRKTFRTGSVLDLLNFPSGRSQGLCIEKPVCPGPQPSKPSHRHGIQNSPAHFGEGHAEIAGFCRGNLPTAMA